MEDIDIKFRALDKIARPAKIKTWEQLLAQYQLTQVFTNSDLFKLMQSTVVPDCEGKESYEGDILKEPSYRLDVDSTQYGVVKKEKDTCNLYVEWNFQRTYDGETYWDKNELPLRKIKELKVVGNVWENKDLLNREDDK